VPPAAVNAVSWAQWSESESGRGRLGDHAPCARGVVLGHGLGAVRAQSHNFLAKGHGVAALLAAISTS
jgi:hypothetical protein